MPTETTGRKPQDLAGELTVPRGVHGASAWPGPPVVRGPSWGTPTIHWRPAHPGAAVALTLPSPAPEQQSAGVER
ncbi:hypothetical protein [Streptomyces griseus]|uniref:hypothetical protein n=1 Tax=Streptomyces griseus TaxID=1911 RepID=UPI00131AC593|nr:hypothetical protein [Streptomyces griseus]